MKIIFMGTPDFGIPTLKALAEAGHEIVAVYTQAPKPAGHGMHEQLSAVHKAAIEMGIPVFTPKNFKKEEDVQQFQNFHADLAIVAAYGILLPQIILDTPKMGCWNIHGSNLPRWRGAAPIQRSIQAGDTTTCLTLQQMNAGLDTGDIISKSQKVDITNTLTAGELHDIFSLTQAPQLVLDAIAQQPTPVPQQEEGATYAHKITKEETLIDFNMPIQQALRFIHAFSPFPGAYCMINNPFHPEEQIRLKVFECELVSTKTNAPVGTILDKDFTVAFKDGALRFKTVQQAGRKRQQANDFLNGMPKVLNQKLQGKE